MLSKFKNKKGFSYYAKVTEEQIVNAELSLGLMFSNEYRLYLKSFGAVSTYGHEFTGICDCSRLNVVEVTTSERKNNVSIPFDWYVIEQANIDGIVVWQSQSGEIYQTIPNQQPKKLCNSLCEYIDL